MLESACVLHISDISPNELFLLHLDDRVQRNLAQGLFRMTGRSGDTLPKDNIFIISAQPTTPIMHRQKRSVNGGVDVLIAVHDPKEKHFIESNHLVQRIHALQANLSKSVGHQIHAYNSLCAQKVPLYNYYNNQFKPTLRYNKIINFNSVDYCHLQRATNLPL